MQMVNGDIQRVANAVSAPTPRASYNYGDFLTNDFKPDTVEPTKPIVYEKDISGITFNFVTSKRQLEFAANKVVIYVDATFGLVADCHSEDNAMSSLQSMCKE